jgi:hypothetical protein
LLNVDEARRFDKLFGQAVRTPEETAELDALAQTGMQRLAEYLGLVGKTTRTAADNARIKELDALAETNGPVVEKLREGPNVFDGPRGFPPTPDDATRQLLVTLAEQNKRIIEQNDQIIAMLKQLVAKK